MSIRRTSLTSMAPLMRDPDPDGARKAAARAWHEHGAAVFSRDSIDRMPWQDRELLEGLCVKLYGERNPT
jgi:hypothetical protein